MAAKKRLDFYDSEEGVEARDMLIVLAADDGYNTEPGYTAKIDEYPDKVLPFVDKHMQYLLAHPGVDARSYIANLRIMTRIR